MSVYFNTDLNLLGVFRAYLGWANIAIDVPMLATMFLAPALQRLQELRFGFDYLDAYRRQYYSPQYEANFHYRSITTHCTQLGALMSNGAQRLRNWRN